MGNLEDGRTRGGEDVDGATGLRSEGDSGNGNVEGNEVHACWRGVEEREGDISVAVLIATVAGAVLHGQAAAGG